MLSELDLRRFRLRYRPVYNGLKGIKYKQCGIVGMWNKKGVYLIRHKGKLVYIGMSTSCVKKALYRHFQTWNDYRMVYRPVEHQYEHISYSNNDPDFKVVIIMTENPVELEKKLILKHSPRDNRIKYTGYSLAGKADEKLISTYATRNEFSDYTF